jgi:hypothetical protein
VKAEKKLTVDAPGLPEISGWFTDVRPVAVGA